MNLDDLRVFEMVAGIFFVFSSRSAGCGPFLEAMVEAIEKRDVAHVRYLIKLKGEAFKEAVNETARENGTSPMYAAIMAKYQPVTRLLIENGADLNMKLIGGTYPLHLSITQKLERTALLMIAKNADVTLVDWLGMTALMHAVRTQQRKIVRALLTKKKPQIRTILEVKERAKRTALLMAAEIPDAECSEVVTYGLLRAGARHGVCDSVGATALHSAVQLKHFNVVNMLLRAGIKPDGKDIFHVTPLHMAVLTGNLATVMALVAKGAAVNALDLDLKTPLDYAMHCKDDNIWLYLVENGGVLGREKSLIRKNSMKREEIKLLCWKEEN